MENLIIADPERADDGHTELTEQLKKTVAKHDLEDLLQASLRRAAKRNPDEKLNPVRTVEEYYDFVDRMGKLIPRDVLHDPPNDLQTRLLQNCAYFYFLIDQPPIDGEDDDGHPGTLQENDYFEDWLEGYVDTWGRFLSSPASWNWTIYRQFYEDDSFGLQNDWYEPASNWETFNDFFSRFLRTPAARPIAQQDDAAVVTSPADSCPQGTWAIDDNSRIHTDDESTGVQVKHDTYYEIPKLLGSDSDYRHAFKNGTFTHTFLNINDYHRYHFPVSGTVVETNTIAADYKLKVKWDEKQQRYGLQDTTGWQFSQTRGSVVIESPTMKNVRPSENTTIPRMIPRLNSSSRWDSVKPGSDVGLPAISAPRVGVRDVLHAVPDEVERLL
jgi:hypothetical protein